MIETRSVSKQYISGRGHVAALTDISFSAARGEGLVLAGRSGSGKTTLLNCIGGLEIPDSGTIVCNGQDLTALSARARTRFRRNMVGFVFQGGNLLPGLTVKENLQFPLELNQIHSPRQRDRITEMLALVGLAGYERALPGELSGGEAQRIALARGMVHAPSLLLADEPTASLDSVTGGQLIELMFALCRTQGTTLCIATHDQAVIARSDRCITLHDGRMTNPCNGSTLK